MSVVAPDWLTRHDGEVRPNPDGHAYLVYFRREPQYLVTPIPAKGKFGCQVETAKSGREALAMARVGTYDAILVDIRLPDLSGYEAYRQLRDAQPQARMVLMTAFGYDASHSLVKARQDGLRFVLYKPFRTDQVIDALVGAPGPAPQPQALRT